VVLGVWEAPDLETHKAANKNLCKVVTSAKHSWANKFLHNATPDQLWTAAKWCFGHRQRLILVLTMDTGLSDQPMQMTGALKKCFFKLVTAEVSASFLDDPPPFAPCLHKAITVLEIEDMLCPMSNKSAPGPSGHNYKLVKWAFAANPTHLQALFEACLQWGHHPKEWKSAIIMVIPKPGKEDYSLPKAYHPVALLKCLGKLLEKVIMKWLTYDISALHLIPTMQFSA
jgi:hypothetical protein